MAHKDHEMTRSESQKPELKYPPPLSEDQFEVLIADIKDWQITHGSLLKLVPSDVENTVTSGLVGTTIFPTLFPESLFQEACRLQKDYNKLYIAVAEDETWLYETLKELIDTDPLTNRLWNIYQEVKQQGYLQDISLGIFRSDYMLHIDASSPSGVQVKQVEFNTIACAGGTHSNIISSMHQHLERTGAYQSSFGSPNSTSSLHVSPQMLHSSHTVKAISSGIASAHHAYGDAQSKEAPKTCVLMIVQPHNFNIADERPIEYALWDQSIPTFRVTFGYDVLTHTSLTPDGELVYRPPHRASFPPMEVSVVYFRAGFEAHEYEDMGHLARFQLERSRAIKCPSVLSHLTTLKKVQQALAMPGTLDRFLSPDEANAISKTFVPLYPLDKSLLGEQARDIGLDANQAKDYVLKPSLEGGGHNIHGAKITEFLEETPQEMWPSYILMRKIVPPALKNFLMSPRGLYEGPVISELGIFGVSLWKRAGKKGAEIIEEEQPSWSFKTKNASVDEMSVVKGYGCFDSPAFVDDETFAACVV